MKQSNKKWVAQRNKELIKLQLKTLGYTTGDTIGEILKYQKKIK